MKSSGRERRRWCGISTEEGAEEEKNRRCEEDDLL
jgi:hypothetical protein